MMEKIDLDRLKKLNEVTRVCMLKTNQYSKDLIECLLGRVSMLEKQKSFLQRKLREKYEKTKDPTL